MELFTDEMPGAVEGSEAPEALATAQPQQLDLQTDDLQLKVRPSSSYRMEQAACMLLFVASDGPLATSPAGSGRHSHKYACISRTMAAVQESTAGPPFAAAACGVLPCRHSSGSTWTAASPQSTSRCCRWWPPGTCTKGG